MSKAVILLNRIWLLRLIMLLFKTLCLSPGVKICFMALIICYRSFVVKTQELGINPNSCPCVNLYIDRIFKEDITCAHGRYACSLWRIMGNLNFYPKTELDTMIYDIKAYKISYLSRQGILPTLFWWNLHDHSLT